VHLVTVTLPGGPASIGPTLSLMDHYRQLSLIGAADEPQASA
jgi:hypothetical protein